MLLKINPIPDVFPRSVSVPSKTSTVAGPSGSMPMQYRFVIGRPLEVTDPVDLEMLLSLRHRVLGYGGKGTAHIPWFVEVGAEESLRGMTREDKVEEAIRRLTGKSLDEFLAAGEGGDPAPAAEADDL